MNACAKNHTSAITAKNMKMEQRLNLTSALL
jgi:hypothetical protein